MKIYSLSRMNTSNDMIKNISNKPKIQNLLSVLDLPIALLGKLQNDQIGLIGAGIAFYFFLAIFPTLAALISLYGLFADPVAVTDQINLLSQFLPQQAVSIFATQAQKIIDSGQNALSLSLFISLGLTIFSASKGVKGIIKGLNITYGAQETRNIIVINFLAMFLTASVVVIAVVFLIAVAILPAVLNLIPLPLEIETVMRNVRWPVLLSMGIISLEFLYRFAPNRKRARWQWVSVGSLIAAILWIGFSALFSWYVSNFGKYNETYGALSAVIVTLIWFWISAVTALLGAEINAVLEMRKKAKDKTIDQETV